MTCLTKEMILAAEAHAREKVDVPEWGGHVYVTAVSAADWMEFQDAAVKEKESSGQVPTAPWVGRVLARTLVDEYGTRLFNDDEAAELMKKPLAIINRLYRAADKLNDLTGRGLRDAEKNSEAGAGGDSSTPSLVN